MKKALLSAFAGLVFLLTSCVSVNFVPESQIVPRVLPLAVTVETRVGMGSGVWIADNLVLTAKHVILTPYGDTPRPALNPVKVRDYAGTVHLAEVVLQGAGDEVQHDWAILRITSEQATVPRYARADCGRRYVGERVVGVGNALSFTGLLPYLGDVQVPAINLAQEWGLDSRWEHAILTNMDGAPGVSGGPVFDMDGDLIGLMVGNISTQFGGTFQSITYPVEFIPVLCGEHSD